MTEESQEHTGGHRIQEGLHHLRDEAHHIQERAEEGMKYVKDRFGGYQKDAGEFLDEAADYVRKNPQRASLISALGGLSLGIIIGILLRGGRH